MHRRLITLADGRYMIFYTFDDEPAIVDESDGGKLGHNAENVGAQPEDTRNV